MKLTTWTLTRKYSSNASKQLLVSATWANPSTCFAFISFFTPAIANSREFMHYLQNANHFNLLQPSPICDINLECRPLSPLLNTPPPPLLGTWDYLGKSDQRLPCRSSLLSILYFSFVKRYFCVGQREIFLFLKIIRNCTFNIRNFCNNVHFGEIFVYVDIYFTFVAVSVLAFC